MKILVTGSSGMLGQTLVPELVSNGHEVYDEYFNICDWDEVAVAFSDAQPDLVIHAAAFTDVDGAEASPFEAVNVNVIGTNNVIRVARAWSSLWNKLPVIYISTDQVLNEEWVGLTEKTTPKPVNTYAMTKLLGEKVVKQAIETYYILRTGWLYGKGKKHYIDYYRTAPEPHAPHAYGSPTSTKALSRMIVKLIEKMPEPGIYNAVCSGYTTKYKLATQFNPNAKMLHKTETMAPRPEVSVLDNSKLSAIIGTIPTWEEALEEYLDENK